MFIRPSNSRFFSFFIHFLIYFTVAYVAILPISLRQPHLSLGQFRRELKRIYLTMSAGPSDFLFLGADHK